MVGEVLNFFNALTEEEVNIGIFVATSPDQLYRDWIKSTKSYNHISHLEKKLSGIETNTPVISIIDGHSSALSWMVY